MLGLAAGLAAGLSGQGLPSTANAIRARQRDAMAQRQDHVADALRYGMGITHIAYDEVLKDLKPKSFKDELQDEIDRWLNDIP